MTTHISPPFMLLLTTEQLTNIHLAISELSPNELAWVSGYLWCMVYQQEDILNISHSSMATFLITLISSSQTGNARYMSEYLYNAITTARLKVTLVNAGSYKFKKIIQEKILLLVVSTQGTGEHPEDAISFYKYLFLKKVPQLQGIAFAIFRLGDASYEKFYQSGKDLDARLYALGGKRLLERADADVNLKTTEQVWTKKMITFLKKSYPQTNEIKRPSDSICNNLIRKNNKEYSKNFPLTATITLNQKITGRHSNKNIHHLEIDLGESGLSYQPGDALGVWYHNDLELVEEIIGLLRYTGDEKVTINGRNMTLSKALTDHFEITQNNTIIVEKYAKLSNNEELIALLSDQNHLRQYAQITPLPDMIRKAPIHLTIEQLLSLLRPIMPRLYSISSSQQEVGKEVHITVGVVCYNADGRARTGGASGYLANRLREDSKLRVFIEHNHNFRLPSNSQAPIIMIGPGTGIAPFRAFIQQRAADKATGLNWLFFGNQHLTEDFLYQLEWQGYIKERVLSRIDLAWSRDQIQKIYVQDKMREQGSELWRWIKNGAYIYVCGNAKQMARDVEYVLIEIFAQHGSMDLEQADEFLSELRVERRYQRDVY